MDKKNNFKKFELFKNKIFIATFKKINIVQHKRRHIIK